MYMIDCNFILFQKDNHQILFEHINRALQIFFSETKIAVLYKNIIVFHR